MVKNWLMAPGITRSGARLKILGEVVGGSAKRHQQSPHWFDGLDFSVRSRGDRHEIPSASPVKNWLIRHRAPDFAHGEGGLCPLFLAAVGVAVDEGVDGLFSGAFVENAPDLLRSYAEHYALR